MADLIFHGQFVHSTDLDGETGLTVTIDVYRTLISDGTTSQVVTDGSCTETGGGIYRYRLASADLSLYHYVANMKTASADVTQKHVACLGVVIPDALISSRLAPTTAARTLDVSAGGAAGVDWANVESPTTTVALSGTTVKTATDVETDTADIQSKIGTPSNLGSGATVAANLVDVQIQLEFLGTGARTVVITVNDGTTVLQGAKVRLTEGANTFVGTTNTSGQVTFNLNDATYTIAITKAGYTYSGSTIVVDGNETKTCSMTAVSFSVSDPGKSTGWVYCYSDQGNVEANVIIQVQLLSTTETTSYAFDTSVRDVISQSDGLAQATGLWIGATYQARRGNETWHTFVVPNAASFALPAMLGW